MSRRSLAPVVLPILILFSPTAEAQDPPKKFLAAPGAKVKGQYVVVFKDDFPAQQFAEEVSQAHSGQVARVWRRALNGALVKMDEGRAQALARDPRVRWVEEDGIVTLNADQVDPPSWGLDRIDQRALPLDESYHSEYSGQGVTVYVLDTGIYVTHQDFGGRAVWGGNFIDNLDQDCHGHGTHVAGTVGGETYGVAKGVDLVAIKVLNCIGSGGMSNIISGVDWVTANAVHPAVANMSLGGLGFSSLDLAVDNSVASGIFYAVAAGNNDGDACFRSPAGASKAFTAGATTSTDERSYFSNWGDCVDIFAPGSAITSTWNTSNSATATLNGTSMASPHVAGVAALVLEQHPDFSVGQVKAEICSRATPGAVGDPEGTVNLLLHALDRVGNYELTLDLTGPGFGNIELSPSGEECNTDCRRFVPPDTLLRMTPTALPGSSFGGWGGDGCSGTQPCEVTMDMRRSISARFEQNLPLRSLTVASAGSGSGVVRSSLPGIDCGIDCAELYGDGTVVTLRAVPAAGSRLLGWTGCAGTDSCTVTLDQDESIVATFETIPPMHELSVEVQGSGEVVSSPPGIDCESECTAPYDEGTVVTLTPTPASGSSFSGWLGLPCSGTGSCSLTMDEARSVSAHFDPLGAHRVAVGLEGTGAGIVLSSPTGIACGVRVYQYTCSAAFPENQVVTLSTTAQSGSAFSGWSGGGCSGSAPCSIAVSGVHLVSAEFTAVDVETLNVTVEGSGRVTSDPSGINCPSDCSEAYNRGFDLTLTAVPSAGSRFLGWNGGTCVGTPSCRLTMDREHSVTAMFEAIYHDLTVTLGGSATGRVMSSPIGIDCGDDCDEPYLDGTMVALAAIAEPRSHFVEWIGIDCEPTQSECAVLMDTARSISAVFGSCFEDFEDDPDNWSASAGPLDDGSTLPWHVVDTVSHSSRRSWFVSSEVGVKDQILALNAPVPVPTGRAMLAFWQRFDTEASVEGGVLEYSTNFGREWFDVKSGNGQGIADNSDRFLLNGYNSTLSDCCLNPLPNREAWSGDSAGWQRVEVDLADFAGHDVLLRWRLTGDASTAGQGWWLDDVELLNMGSCALGQSLLFADSFESGDLALWSASP